MVSPLPACMLSFLGVKKTTYTAAATSHCVMPIRLRHLDVPHCCTQLAPGNCSSLQTQCGTNMCLVCFIYTPSTSTPYKRHIRTRCTAQGQCIKACVMTHHQQLVMLGFVCKHALSCAQVSTLQGSNAAHPTLSSREQASPWRT